MIEGSEFHIYSMIHHEHAYKKELMKKERKKLSFVRSSQPLQGSVEVQLLLVIESVVEAKLCFQQIDLVIRAGAADNVAACELSKLPNDLTDGACSR
jgi:hypothetical protein